MKRARALVLGRAQSAQQLQGAARVLAQSFHDEATFTTLFPDSARRARALPHVFGLLVRDAAPFEGVTLALQDGQLLGAAVWFPPAAYRLTFRRQLRALPALLRVFLAAPASFTRFAAFGAALENLHPPTPHWYLAALGVVPDGQGRGIGTALLRDGLGRADEARHSSYLETFREATVRLYWRHGFEVLRDSVEIVSGAPPFTLMWRDAPRWRVATK